MKSIRNIAFSAFLTFAAFSAVTFTSCNKDECKDVNCNTGTCNESDGSCTCPTGFEGDNCEIKSNAKFVGTWVVAETCAGTPSDPYQVIITADPTVVNGVLVSNLGDYNCTLGGTISYNGTVNKAALTINDNKCNTQINATGEIVNGVLTINYTAKYGTSTDNCTAVLSK